MDHEIIPVLRIILCQAKPSLESVIQILCHFLLQMTGFFSCHNLDYLLPLPSTKGLFHNLFYALHLHISYNTPSSIHGKVKNFTYILTNTLAVISGQTDPVIYSLQICDKLKFNPTIAKINSLENIVQFVVTKQIFLRF